MNSNTITICALSDLHWHTHSELQMLKSLSYDLCVLLGDIPNDTIQIIKQFNEGKPIIGVAGNHDDWDTPERGGIENIHGQCVHYCGYSFAGISGSSRYKEGNYPMFTQKESMKIGSRLAKADILLSHDSMYHLLGKDTPHSGLLGIDWYNIRHRTRLNICGHHHTASINRRWGTTSVCVFRCALTTYPNITVTRIF